MSDFRDYIKPKHTHYVRFDENEWAELTKAVSYNLLNENDAIEFVTKNHSHQHNISSVVRGVMLGIVRGKFKITTN